MGQDQQNLIEGDFSFGSSQLVARYRPHHPSMVVGWIVQFILRILAFEISNDHLYFEYRVIGLRIPGISWRGGEIEPVRVLAYTRMELNHFAAFPLGLYLNDDDLPLPQTLPCMCSGHGRIRGFGVTSPACIDTDAAALEHYRQSFVMFRVSCIYKADRQVKFEAETRVEARFMPA